MFQNKEFHVSNMGNVHSVKMVEASCSKPAKSIKNGVSCLACKVHVRKHPPYTFTRFKVLPCGQCTAIAIKNQLYTYQLPYARSLPVAVSICILMQGVSEVTPHSVAPFV